MAPEKTKEEIKQKCIEKINSCDNFLLITFHIETDEWYKATTDAVSTSDENENLMFQHLQFM